MNIGIIGQGFVGNAVREKFENYYGVRAYDLKAMLSTASEQEALDNEIVFICLPTPMNKDGSCYTDIVEKAIKRAVEFGIAKIVVIKSTVSPGTCAKWNKKFDIDVVFNPEFLTEANAVKDYENQTRVILGGPRKSTTKLKPIFKVIFLVSPNIISVTANESCSSPVNPCNV
jgi:UDPglucose 6-dehydrogenase